MKESEIHLGDLAVEILLHWRSMIIFMLIAGALGGLFSYIGSARSCQEQAVIIEELKKKRQEKQQLEELWQEKQLSNDETALKTAAGELLSSYGIMLNEQQTNNVDYVLNYEKNYYSQLEYQKQSVLMQIDPNNVQRGEMTILIISDDLEKSYNIERIYEDIVCSAELLEEMGRQSGLETKYINEIYSLTRSASDSQTSGDTFKITISHYDKELCLRFMQNILDYIDSKRALIEKKRGPHEVINIEQAIATISVKSIANAQASVAQNILDIKTNILNRKSSFTNEEWYYYNLLTIGKLIGSPYGSPEDPWAAVYMETLETTADYDAAVTPKFNIVYVLGSMILFSFTYAFLIFMKYVLNNKIKSTDQFDELYKIPQLGHIPTSGSEKKPLDFIDKGILAFRNRNKRRFTQNEAVNLAAAAVKMAARKDQLDTICLIGCTFNDTALSICKDIQDNLAKDGINVYILDNVLYNAQTMEKLSELKGAVLAETAGNALYTEIAQELELLKRQQINILGGMILE